MVHSVSMNAFFSFIQNWLPVVFFSSLFCHVKGVLYNTQVKCKSCQICE